MINDWKEEIARAWMVKQALMEADKGKIWTYHLPELAATESEIQKVEGLLGVPLDQRYREFLKHANGWQSFWHTADLFGTHDLIGGPKKENAEFVLGMLEEGVLQNSGVRREHLLPISATKFDRDIFVLLLPNSPSPGSVLWFAGEEIDRFPTFDDYFLATVDYNRVAIKRFADQEAK